jgi:hypothetical protein
MADKKIVRVNIFAIKAGKHILCGPPALWDMEAAVDVTYDDRTTEVQYISTMDLSEAGWQIMTKSIDDLGNEESAEPYIVESWGEDEYEEAISSPYGSAITTLESIFKSIAVL